MKFFFETIFGGIFVSDLSYSERIIMKVVKDMLG